jgi:hypothetical protein
MAVSRTSSLLRGAPAGGARGRDPMPSSIAGSHAQQPHRHRTPWPQGIICTWPYNAGLDHVVVTHRMEANAIISDQCSHVCVGFVLIISVVLVVALLGASYHCLILYLRDPRCDNQEGLHVSDVPRADLSGRTRGPIGTPRYHGGINPQLGSSTPTGTFTPQCHRSGLSRLSVAVPASTTSTGDKLPPGRWSPDLDPRPIDRQLRLVLSSEMESDDDEPWVDAYGNIHASPMPLASTNSPNNISPDEL